MHGYTADLALMEESSRVSDFIDKPLSRRPVLVAGHAGLDATYQDKDGSFLRARFILHGADYYLLATHSRSRTRSFNAFFSSFAFTPYRYPSFRNYCDTFNHINVN